MIDERFFYFWEETEWCIRIGHAGWEIVHVPQAKMWHKGVTIDNQPKPSVTYYATRNRLLTLSKHKAPFRVRAFAWGRITRALTSWTIKPRWRHMRHHRDAMRQGAVDFLRGNWGPETNIGQNIVQILFLSKWFPFPTNNGSKLRIYNLLRGLAAQHEVTLISFDDQSRADPQVPELRAICKEIHIVPWKEYNPQSRRARLGFFSMTPRSYIDTFSPQMQTRIERILSSGDYDLVIASEWEMAGYGSCVRETTVLFEDIELGVLYGQYAAANSVSKRLRCGLTWLKHQRYLSRLLSDFDACTVPSDIELELLTNAVPDYKNVAVIPNCINLADYSAVCTELQPFSLIFTGSFRYAVNYDAMFWFLQNIYPLIRSEVPNVQLTITGDPAGQTLPATDGVTQSGFVPDVRPLFPSAWASVVPLRSGGGTRLKILEAMALRTPVITTSKGAEGIDVEHGDSVLIADEPAEFAAAVVQLLREPELREHLADNAYQLVSEQYDWAGVMPRFMQLIDDVVWAV